MFSILVSDYDIINEGNEAIRVSHKYTKQDV